MVISGLADITAIIGTDGLGISVVSTAVGAQANFCAYTAFGATAAACILGILSDVVICIRAVYDAEN